MFAKRLAHIDPARGEERVRHTPANDQVLDFADKVLKHVKLGRYFCPAHNSGHWLLGIAQSAVESFQFSLHRAPCIGWQVLGNPLCRRMSAVRCRKRIIHVKIAMRRDGLREIGIISLFARPKPCVVQEADIAIA